VQAALQALQQGETPFVEEAPVCCMSTSHELLGGSRILLLMCPHTANVSAYRSHTATTNVSAYCY
jgi:hypothetical protein